MQKITAGAASGKISELRSKLACYEAWIELITANYLPSDSGPPEIRIFREDGGTVTAAHLEVVLGELGQRCAELREELTDWEGLVFEPVAVRPVRAVPAPKIVPAEKGKAHGRRLHPAPKDSGGVP